VKSGNIVHMEDNNLDIQTENQKKIKKTRIWISIILAIIGLILIASQVVPLCSSYIDGWIEEIKIDIRAEPVPDSYKTYIEQQLAYYDPGKSYFANLSQEAGTLNESSQYYDVETQTQKDIVIDKDYNKPMYLTIDSIGIENIKVTPNVDSYDQTVYDEYLKEGLAHFKGTPLPGDGGNSFIYGHSAVESFFNSHQNLPETIFSKLSNIDIGEEVDIKKDDKILKYVVRSKKIVSPDDFSILQTQDNKETITMMTCWPLGIGTKRLIVVAEREI
jgi:LPXTG-site transpeptidase (sortase) family protein